MGFLDQLKAQANEKKVQQGEQVQSLHVNVETTEAACTRLWHYLSELAAQLNVLQPATRTLSLDGRTPWPAMKLTEFRFDARKKILRQREVTEHVAMGWLVRPLAAPDAPGQVSVNFPPDLERVEARLRAGQVPHQRLEVRHPESHKLQALVFEHEYAARGGVVFTADHDQALLRVRLNCLTALDVQELTVPASRLTSAWLDDMARALVGEASTWAPART